MKAIECKWGSTICRKLVKNSRDIGLPGEWYLCKKCHEELIKKREVYIDSSRGSIGETVNFSLNRSINNETQ